MKRFLVIVFSLFFLHSCIPYAIAPKLKDDKVMLAKKFKRKLPKRYAFIFKDTKEADEFYNYVNTKFQLNNTDVNFEVPFFIENTMYFMSYNEVRKKTSTLNLIPIAVDAALERSGNDPVMQNHLVSHWDNWYIAITISSNTSKDCLKPNHPDRKKLVLFLKDLKNEYLSMQNYNAILFK